MITKKLLSPLLSLSLAFSSAPALAGIVLGPSAGPRGPQAGVPQAGFLTLHHAVFSRKASLLPLLREWNARRDSMSLEDRQAANFLLKAVSAPNLDAAGRLVFGAGLDPAPQQMAAEVVLQFWSEMMTASDKGAGKPLADEVMQTQLRLWGQSALSSIQRTGQAQLEASAAFRDLETALNTWKPRMDAVERVAEINPAVLAWRRLYEAELGLKASLPPADWLRHNAVADSGPELTGGQAGRGPGAGKGRWAGKGRRGVAPEATAGKAALDTVPMSEALLAIFDADDNLYVNVNAVHVFKKGSGHKEQVRIPSEEFTEARGQLGEPGKYADYEEWTDPVKGSYREFRAPLDPSDPILETMEKDVWFFKKGTNHREQVAIPAAEYERVRDQVGQPGKYADYETWDHPFKGSWREIKGLPKGYNPLLENVKEAFAARTLADLLGKSWDAFHYILSVNPKAVYILTAGGLPGEMYIETFEWMKNQGLIPAVPPVENIHGVGNPKHPFYSSMLSPSVAKLKQVKALLDMQQALAKKLGKRAPRLWNAEGKGFAHLLPAGFSDDDRGNYITMRDGAKDKAGKIVETGLAWEFKEGRWPDLKVTLFYQDRDDPESGAFVIKPDGTLREVTADEFGETYVEGNTQEEGSNKRGKGPKRVPYPEKVRVDVPNVDALIDRVYFTVDSPKVRHPKVVTNADQIEIEAAMLRDFIRLKLPKGVKKSFIAERYTADDPRIAAALEEAVDSGVPGDLVFDANTAMRVDFKPDEAMTTDLSRARLADTEGGRFLGRLLAKGWRINERKAKWRIATQPFYNHDDEKRDPLVHRKRIITVLTYPDGRKVYRELDSSGNWSNQGQRVNMLVETSHPAIVEHSIRNCERIIDTFLALKPINQIKAVRPRLIITGKGKEEDEETLFLGHTDGQYNTNDMYVNVVERTVNAPADYKLLDAGLYHFVITYGRGVKALAKALDLHPQATLNVVADMKFSAQSGWGLSPVMGGHLVLQPFQPVFPWPRRIRDRVNGLAYQRIIAGRARQDLEGIPSANFIYHLKLSLARVLEKGREWRYVSVGSLNFSNNYHNAEHQWLMRLKPASPWHGLFHDMAWGHAEAHPEWGVPLWRGPWRDTLARLIGHAPEEIPLAELPLIEKAAKGHSLTVLGFRLMSLLEKGTSLIFDTFPPEAAKRNILRFLRLLGLYGDLESELAGRLTSLYIQRTSTAALSLAYKEHSPYSIRTALRSLLWEPNISPESLNSLVDRLWQVVGYDQHLEEMAELLKAEKEAKARAKAGGSPGA